MNTRNQEPPSDLLAQANTGNVEAQCELGIWYARQGTALDLTSARTWLQEAASAGSHRAEYNLGVLVLNTDREAARQRFYRAATYRYVPGMRALAAMAREDGKEDTAYRWLQHAANEGDPVSKFEIAHALMNSEHPQDQALLFQYASDAAASELPEAQALLATAYHEGIGTERSPTDAFHWFREAAIRRHAGASAMLGVAYHVGAGTKVSKLHAAKWLLRAIELESPIAAAYWSRVSKELSPAEVEQAKELAKSPFADDA